MDLRAAALRKHSLRRSTHLDSNTWYDILLCSMRRIFIETSAFTKKVDGEGREMKRTYLLGLYGRGEKADLSQDEKKVLKGLVERLKREAR